MKFCINCKYYKEEITRDKINRYCIRTEKENIDLVTGINIVYDTCWNQRNSYGFDDCTKNGHFYIEKRS